MAQEAVFQALDERERCYWSKEAFLRCLRATKWVYADALKRAEETLVWRREFAGGVDQMPADLVSHEGETGKEIVFGFDVSPRAVVRGALTSDGVLTRTAGRVAQANSRPVLYMVGALLGSEL